MPAKLSVNLNAVAMLRNRRDLAWPNVKHIGRLALGAGAHGLTVHPRPDQRHTRDSDVPILRGLIDDEFPDAEFNVEGYPTPEFIQLVLDNEPDQVTLVPDDPAQATSDHGWDFIANQSFLSDVVWQLKTAEFRVALFCDPDASEDQLKACKDIGGDRVELYTEPYAASSEDKELRVKRLADLVITARNAQSLGLGVNAGHDLTLDNLPDLVAEIPFLDEASIGHALTADCLEFGIIDTVHRYLAALGNSK